jgi:hypothetical protein
MKTNASIRNVPHKNSRFNWLVVAALLLGSASAVSAKQLSATEDGGARASPKAETERRGPSQAEIAMAADLAKIAVKGGPTAPLKAFVRALAPETIGCQTINCPNGGR